MSKWIKCTDYLPEEGVHCLVMVEDEDLPKTGFYEDMWIVSSSDQGGVGEEFYEDEQITHWMPLPEKPNE